MPSDEGSELLLHPRSGHPALDRVPIERLCIHTIRTLAMDAVQAAGSGHPGTPMALAPIAYVLWTREMRYNPRDPHWFDRDRFVLSNGHACMLLYAVLHLTGYDLGLEDIKKFRQWGSRTPGHPEAHLTPGVEATTGPLGQGCANSLGMAMAEAHLAAVLNRDGHRVVDHRTYVVCSDGDMMEGATHEAASLAGHLGLHKLTWIYDDNRITIEGPTELAFSEDVARRFEGYGWHVQNLGEAAEDLEALSGALAAARGEAERPSLLIVRTHIGYGAPNRQDTAEAHGAPLGEEEVAAAKRAYGWPEEEKFLVPPGVREHMRSAGERGGRLQAEWGERLSAWAADHPDLAARLERALRGELPPGWEDGLPGFAPGEGPLATRAASGKVLNAIARRVPWVVGGSGDLAPSTNTLISDSGDFARGAYGNRNFRWGVREHAMVGASSGIALHGGLRPYAATFFVFTDYARPAIRLAALMGLPTIFVMTHDSIGLGEDGPTHQPIEHLASLRAMPGMRVVRPADANEVAWAWRVALRRTDGPTMLVLTRQKVPVLDRAAGLADAEGLTRGAYVLRRESGGPPHLVLIATGSEVSLALEAERQLSGRGLRARVVSMPCWELFRQQPREYRDEVLPPRAWARLAIEAGASLGWREWVGEAGAVLGIDRFGASAPAADAFRGLGFTVEEVVARALRLVGD